MFLIFDTETTGLPKKWNSPLTDFDNWPRAVQIAWQIHSEDGKCISNESHLIYPEGYTIPYDSQNIHGISTQLAKKIGKNINEVLDNFNKALNKSEYICGHNLNFDEKIIGSEFLRIHGKNPLQDFPRIDTCTEETATLCQLSGGRGRKYKLPTLTELHINLFGKEFDSAHNASADVEATARCLFKLLKENKIHPESLENDQNIYKKFKEIDLDKVIAEGIKHINLSEQSKILRDKEDKLKEHKSDKIDSSISQSSFAHLHTYSQFSILQSTSKIEDLLESAKKYSHDAVAITDKSNLMGAFHFIKVMNNYNENLIDDEKYIKPIIGCEFNICEDHKDKSRRDDGYQLVFIAKNKNGFRNLSKLSSIAHIDGFYYVPRIDKDILMEYKEDLIVLSGGLKGEVSSKILNLGEEMAEDSIKWWKNNFDEDFYLEIMNHNQENENYLNPIIVDYSIKHDVKLVATNNTFYTEKDDANAHDILLCVRDGEKQSTPIGRGRGFRNGLPNHEYWYKPKNEMFELFKEIPQSLASIEEIINKVETFDLSREVLLPEFKVPKKFVQENDFDSKKGQNLYLRDLAYKGAEKKYGKLNKLLKERLDFELDVIQKTGYPGYFLIVQDFIMLQRIWVYL